MRFGRQPSPPPYLNRRDQFRLLVMTGLLMLVVIAAVLARNPRYWTWVTNPEQLRGKNSGQQEQRERIDRTIKEAEPLDPGVVRVVDGEDPPLGPPDGEGVLVDPAILSEVEDNTLGIVSDDRRVYEWLLEKARRASASDLERAASSDFTYNMIMTETKRFRGKLLTIDGRLHRLTRFNDGADAPTRPRYDAWILTADSAPDPYRVIVTGIPEGIPTGMQIEEDVRVRVSGYFFKRVGYVTEDKRPYTAPLLLGRRLRWIREAAAPSESETDTSLALYIAWFCFVLAAVFGLMVWRFSVSDRRFQQEHLHRLTAAPQEDIDALKDVPTTDASEMFRDLGEPEERQRDA